MKPLFTLHAGEYLVGSFIQKKYKKKEFKVWIPAKDEGIDLLITDKIFRKSVSLQVKWSKDYKPTYSSLEKYKACGWWTIEKPKLETSQADFWVFILYSMMEKNQHYIIIEPKTLLSKLTKIHDVDLQKFNIYFWLTTKHKCWEGRGLKKKDKEEIVEGNYKNEERDFSEYLNQWEKIENKLK
ncbi:MAG: hypothetical protein ACE5KK_05290 [Candidatus Brocadiales bacterium]